MARSITYSPRALAAIPTRGLASKKPDDDYQQRLLKYIPAETLAFYAPISTAIGSSNKGALILVTIVGIIGNVIYNLAAPGATRTRIMPHFYVLSVIAFLVWAASTTPPLSSLAGLDDLTVRVILGCTVFLLPPVDTLLARWGV